MLILTKIIFIAMLLGIAYMVVFRIETVLFHRLLAVLGIAAIAALIVQPGWSTRVANVFGIGRGADFVFYFAHLFLFYLVARAFLELQRLRRDLAKLVRDRALADARSPGTGPSRPDGT